MTSPHKLPLAPQHDAVEDGAACLAMVMACFGKSPTMTQCRAACASEDNEITTEHLVEAARTLGLRAKDWVIEGVDAFDVSLALPAIVSWHGHYFVVVERVTRTHVTLFDPAVGRRRLTRELFDRFCSGVAVTFARGGTRGLSSPMRTLLRDVFLDPETRWMAVLLIVSTIALQICSLALPLGVLFVVDDIPRGVEPSLSWVLVAALLVVTAHVILRFVRNEVLVHLRRSVDARWKQRASRDLLMRVGGLDGLPGYLVSRLIVVGLQGWFVIFSLVLVGVWSLRLTTMAGVLTVGVVAASALISVGEVMRGLQQFLIARARFERICRVFDAADERGE